MKLIVTSKATQQSREAYNWYTEKTPNVAERFSKSLQRTIDTIEEFPEIYAVISNRVRKAKLDKFPYAVFFKVDRSTITVMAVLHLHRKPRRW